MAEINSLEELGAAVGQADAAEAVVAENPSLAGNPPAQFTNAKLTSMVVPMQPASVKTLLPGFG